ncbi:MAG TPA: PspA/IM30 family protein [Candidatus Baltobacteraceae bacterium]|jgi:phage shock protein A|nr:PspA/IM30 family protein [Candidatus Baltobacteraceae bacterium]
MTHQEGFLERWMRIIRQKFAAKERTLDDPAEAIDVLLQNQMEAIAQGRTDLIAVGSSEKRLQALLDEFAQRAAKYETAARDALAAGNRDAARTQARRAIESERLAQEGRAHLVDVSAQKSELSDLIEEMRAQYDRLRMRREAVNAMATSARATASGNETLSAAGGAGAERERTLEAARETLARLRARSAALAELRSSGALDAVGAAEFDASSGVSDAEVDRKLDALNP